MNSEAEERRILHHVTDCPRCGGSHEFPILVRIKVCKKPAVPIFAGEPPTTKLAFICPTTRDVIEVSVPNPSDGEVVGPATADDAPTDSLQDELLSRGAIEAEYTEWVKVSRATAVDFCKTMITASIGAVPIYFALLKYLGAEAAASSILSRIGGLPPLLFLISTIIFALALRPRLAWVNERGFGEFRAARLKWLNIYMLGGLAVFAIAIVIAIALGVRLLKI